MNTRIYLEIIARIAILILSLPLLEYLVSTLYPMVEVMRGGVVLSPELALLLVNLFTLTLSLVLLVASIAYLDPLLYTLSLLLSIPVILQAKLVLGPGILLALLLMLVSNVVLQGYRSGQVGSFRVRGLPVLLISTTSIVVAIATISYAVALVTWSYVEALRGIEVGSSVLAPFVRFFSTNPLGLAMVVAVVIAVVYSMVVNLSETLALYLKPSREVAVRALALNPFTPIKPPLTSLRNAMITLAISPAIYALLVKAIPQLNPLDSATRLDLAIARWLLSLLVLTITWILVTRMLTRFDEVEPGVGGVLAGVVVVTVFLTLLVASNLWDPRIEGLNLERADKELANIVLGYYRVLFSILEIVPMLIGLTP